MGVMDGGQCSGGATKTNLDSRTISILDITQDSPYTDILCNGEDADDCDDYGDDADGDADGVDDDSVGDDDAEADLPQIISDKARYQPGFSLHRYPRKWW